MRIAFLLTQLEAGGAQAQMFQSAKELRRRGHEVTVLVLYAKRQAFDEEPKTIVSGDSRPRWYHSPIVAFQLWKALRRGRFDAIVCRTAPANILGSLVAFLAGISVRVAMQSRQPDKLDPSHRILDFVVGVSGLYSVNVANSDFTRGRYASYPESYRRRMVTLYNGVDAHSCPESREVARAELGIPRRAFVVSTVGRLSAPKDQATLIRAMAGIEGILYIAGEGELRPMLEGLSRDVCPDGRVVFLGELPRRTVALLLRASDVFVFPSIWESFGLALVEAAGAGVALVVSDLPVVAEVLGASGGEDAALYVRPGDVGGFASAVRQLRENPQLRERLSEASRHVVARYSLSAHVSGLEEILSRRTGAA